ncbi:hypothetical protein ACGFX4_38870 [Kitasatospora sp. NPDC048365]|uniref:hypothetical protein n=1 Tax=Kitasatospora sp. NPDC048365 TaxID=3364050 RepID=UPI003712FED9
MKPTDEQPGGAPRGPWRHRMRVLGRRALLGAAYTAGGLPLTLLGHWLISR